MKGYYRSSMATSGMPFVVEYSDMKGYYRNAS